MKETVLVVVLCLKQLIDEEHLSELTFYHMVFKACICTAGDLPNPERIEIL